MAVICFEWLQRPENVVWLADLARLPQQECGRTPYASSITRTKLGLEAPRKFIDRVTARFLLFARLLSVKSSHGLRYRPKSGPPDATVF